MLLTILALLLLGTLPASGYYSCAQPCSNMCCSVPSDSTYVLTTFCDSSTACGPSCYDVTWFSADSQRFGCNANLSVCSGSNCVTVQVIDAGPAAWVEKDAGMAVLDASANVCQQLFGSSSCGWSDGNQVVVTMGDPAVPREPGPFQASEEDLLRMHKYHQKWLASQGHLDW